MCSQCGAVLPIADCVCQFCSSSFSVGFSAIEEASDISSLGIPPRNAEAENLGMGACESCVEASREATQEGSWRGELADRVNAYRTRRRKVSANDRQTYFSFEESVDETQGRASVAIEGQPASEEEFSFTLAIGRSQQAKTGEELPVEIDVSTRPDANAQALAKPREGRTSTEQRLYPVASIEYRRLAALIDFFCLLFAYGGFLGLFGSLGGHFTLSKLSVAVCAMTFAVVYLQYFALFTNFGGTTPGMMLRGLQVVGFSGEPPTSRQMLLRSVGYALSAGTFFLGFLWAMWDSDELTWHDRLSRTYLSVEQTLPELEGSEAARSR